MTVEMLRQEILRKQKRWRRPTQDPPLANSTNRTVEYSLTLKKYELVFKIGKDHLRIVLFLRSVLSRKYL